MALVFDDMAENIARARQDQLRFLASIAHDIRNPLSAIGMSSELLLEDGGLDEHETRQMLAIIGRQTTHLNRLVTDILDLARTQSGQIELELQEHDMRTLVRDAVGLYEKTSEAHRLEVTLPADPVPCRCDGNRIAQVLNNLLSNAIKYSPYGGKVSVIAARRDGEVVIDVTDEGIGIAPGEVDRIFEPFRRSVATKETIPGIGLGLAASRRLVELHGGRIEVDSQPGRGSTFRVVLPAAKAVGT
jgi:signal transduction histidine kinase